MLLKYLVGITSRRSTDKVQELGSKFLREDIYFVVKLRLGDSYIPDSELRVCLGKPYLNYVSQKAGSFIKTLLATGVEGGNRLPISSSLGASSILAMLGNNHVFTKC